MNLADESSCCRGTTRTGQPCRARPVKGSAYCPAHNPPESGRPRRLASIDDVIADLLGKQERLSALLDEVALYRAQDEAEVNGLVKLFGLHSQNASRLGRLLRDRQALGESPAEALLVVIDQALDELSRELGLEL